MTVDAAFQATIAAVNAGLAGYEIWGRGAAWNLLIRSEVELETRNELVREALTRVPVFLDF